MSDHDNGAAAAAANEPIGQQATAIADTISDDMLNIEPAEHEDEPQQRQDVQDEGAAAPEKPQRAPVDDGQDPNEAEEEATEPEDKADDHPAEDDDDAKARQAAAEDAKTVKIDGREIPIAEIKRGFLRQQDYTRKTQELAQVRQAVEGQAQRLQASEAELGKILDIAVGLVKARMPQPPDPAMIETDPQGYLRHQEAYRRAMGEAEQIMQAQAQVGQRSQAETEAQKRQSQQQFQQALQEQADALAEKIPELRTQAGWDTLFSEVDRFGSSWGLKREDVAGVQDHRQHLVLRDALAYRKLQAAKPAAVERAKTAPPIPTATRQPQGTRPSAIARANERLRREGSVDAAAAALPDSWFS